MRSSPVAVVALVCVGVCGAAALVAWAGPLNPPPGAVSPTYKTLSEVEPRTAINAVNTPGTSSSVYRITQPGSYYLTGNVAGVAAKNGIEITVSDVMVDLCGFEVLGVAGSLDGVAVTTGSIRNISVVNGIVRSWGQNGVDLHLVTSSRVSGLHASDNAISGLLGGPAGDISHCVMCFNGTNGILSGNNSTITACTASQNGSTGIDGGVACTIRGCTATSNSTSGINGFTGSLISNCTTRQNGTDGIIGSTATLVIGNNSSGNGTVGSGAGIHLFGGDSRVEGNNCTGSDTGILVEGAGNIIVRNTCSGNTTANWNIVANNVYGPIIDRSAPASAAVMGNSATSTLGSTDPNANFTY